MSDVSRPREEFRLPRGTQLKVGTVETPWELIAPGDLVGSFGVENGRALVAGMKKESYPAIRKCAAEHVPPESMVQLGGWSGKVVLDIESSVDGYEIVDAQVTESSYGDSQLESCIVSGYVGAQVPVETAELGMRYRLEYPVIFRFGAPEVPAETPWTEAE